MTDFREAERKSVDALLRRRFPDGCVACALQRKSCSERCNGAVASQLRKLSSFEIVCQGDDWADAEHCAINSEALNYARAAAVVKSLEWSVADVARTAGSLETQARLKREPFMGELRAKVAYELATTGSCQQLCSFERGQPPVGRHNQLRVVGEGGRSMRHADAKLALSKVVGLPTMVAIALVEGEHRVDGKTVPAVRSIAALRADARLVASLRQPFEPKQENGEFTVVKHALAHYDELQLPVSADEARACLEAVQFEVRRQHSLRVGAKCDCPPPPRGAPLCTCCWHAELVGGARTRGRAGHDVDILLWHATEAASRGGTARDYVIHDLARGVLVPGDDGGWKTNGGLQHRGDASGRLLRPDEGFQCIFRRKHSRREGGAYRNAAWKEHVTQLHGKNLKGDWHDKLFGLWQQPSGRLHRLDIIVVAQPEEVPFARLTWTGSRTFNRLTRLRAIHLGLDLGPHGFTAKEAGTFVLDARREPPLTVTLPALGVVPYEHMKSEEDILRVLARGTDEFEALYDPRNRNA